MSLPFSLEEPAATRPALRPALLQVSERAWLAAGTAAGLLLFVAMAAVGYYRFTNDDSFIFFRYASNFASGYGLAYNAGQRVEGFTSLAWTLLLTPFAPSSSLLLGSKLLGLGCALITLLAFSRTLLAVVEDRRLALVGLWLLCLNQLFISWVFSGMDVNLYLAWQTVFLLLIVAGHVENPRQRLAAVALSAVGFIIRPEAYLVVGLGWVAWAGLSRPWLRRHAASFVRALGAVGVFGMLPFLFRLWYFGKLLPNTFYAKSFYASAGGDNRLGLTHGLAYLTDSASYVGWTFLWLAVAGLLYLSWVRPRARPLALAAGALAAYLVLIGGDVLTQRSFLYLVPTLLIGLVAALQFLLNGKSVRVTAMVIGSLLLFTLLQSVYQFRQPSFERISQLGNLYVPNNGTQVTQSDYPAGQYLAQNARPDDVLLTDNIGAVGYASHLRILDAYGLTDSRVADSIYVGGKPDQVLDLLLAQAPEWILCNVQARPDGGIEYRFYVAGGGFDITQWAHDHSYRPVGRWDSNTGYWRILLHRTES